MHAPLSPLSGDTLLTQLLVLSDAHRAQDIAQGLALAHNVLVARDWVTPARDHLRRVACALITTSRERKATHHVKSAYNEEITLSGIGCTWKLVSPSPMWTSFGVPTRFTVTPSKRPPLTTTYLSSSCQQHGLQGEWSACSNAVPSRHTLTPPPIQTNPAATRNPHPPNSDEITRTSVSV